RPGARFAVLTTGVAGDLVALGIFKYAGFFAATARSGSIAEGYNCDAMVRNFERDAVGLIGNNPAVIFDIYFAPLFDPALRGDARRLAGNAENRLRLHGLRIPAIIAIPNVRLHDFRDV